MLATTRTTGFWRGVRAALAGEHLDFTSGDLRRPVLMLAVPMVLEMSMQSLFSVMDVFFVGRLGSAAVAVVGLTDSLLAIVFAVALGLSMGTTAMVARRVGAGRPDEAAEAAGQAIAVGTLVAAVVAVVGVLHADALLGLLGAGDALAATGRTFAAITLGANVTIVLLFLVNAVFRGAGDAVRAMHALWIANGINIVLDPVLIFGLGPVPALGLEGAAIATAIGRGIGVAYQLWVLMRPGGRIVVQPRHLLPRPAVMARLVRISAVGVLQFFIGTTSYVVLFRVMALFGASALAGYTIAVRVIMFVLLPAWGMGNAAATLVGQNLGAGKPERAEASVWLAARYNSVFLAGVAVVLVVGATPLLRPFTADPVALELGARCLRIVSASYVFWGFGMITIMAFNGAGDTTTPTWIHFLVLWVLQLPLAWLLSAAAGLGPTGVFVAIAAAQIATAVVGVAWFRRGSWKLREI